MDEKDLKKEIELLNDSINKMSTTKNPEELNDSYYAVLKSLDII